jgi:hypothetical protein
MPVRVRLPPAAPHLPCMHEPGVVAAAVRLSQEGISGVAIARDLGVPRGTVRDWLAGKVPRSSRLFSAASGELCDTCGGEPHDFGQLPPEYAYLLGLYLGDGCISAGPRGVFRLRIALDKKYPAIIDECARAVAAVLPRNRVGRFESKDGYWEVSSYSKAWPCYFPQHGPGKKHNRGIVLDVWQQRLVADAPGLLLRGLIHSDGSRFDNSGAPRYNFRQRSDGIRAIFCDACDLLGVAWTPSRNDTIYVSRKADVAKLDAWVGPKR